MIAPRPPPWLITAASLLSLAALIVDLSVFGSGPPHAILLAILVVAAMGFAWTWLPPVELVLLAGATLACLGLLYHADVPFLLVALAVGGFLAAPPIRYGWSALVSAAASSILAGLLLQSTPAFLVALVVGPAVDLMRPRSPSVEQRRILELVGLFLPALLLAGALLLNAATGRGDPLEPRLAVRWAVAFLGVLFVVALAMLGISAVARSDHPRQANLWLASSVCVAVTCAALSKKDPSLALHTLSSGALPLALLATIGVSYLARQTGIRRPVLMGCLLASSLVQMLFSN